MRFARGYAALAVGAVGTTLASITMLAAIAAGPGFQALFWPSRVLFVVAGISGITQWITYARRRYGVTLVLFGVTLLSWSAAALLHAVNTSPDCDDKPCLVVVKVDDA